MFNPLIQLDFDAGGEVAIDGSDLPGGELVVTLGQKGGNAVVESRRIDSGTLLAKYVLSGSPVTVKVVKGEGTSAVQAWVALGGMSPEVRLVNVEASAPAKIIPLTPAVPLDVGKTGFLHVLTEE